MNIIIFFLGLLSTLGCVIANGNFTFKTAKVKLNSGDSMPWVGFGTSGIEDYEGIKQVLDYALAAGYRHIDTAQVYYNEEVIGRALKELLPKHNLTRQDLFLTSKLNSNVHSPQAGYAAVKESLRNLQTDYLDLYLIHHPAAFLRFEIERGPIYAEGPQNKENRIVRWKELVQAKEEGLVRNIGVSNFGVKHLKELLEDESGVKPAVNQIKFNPYHQPRNILDFCKKENIVVEAWSPLGGSKDSQALRNHTQIKEIAEKLGKTPSQVILRWLLQEGIAVIQMSKSKQHIEENIDLDFDIPDEDIKTLNDFEQKHELNLESID